MYDDDDDDDQKRMTTSRKNEEEERGTTTTTTTTTDHSGVPTTSAGPDVREKRGHRDVLAVVRPEIFPHDVPNFYDVSGICENPKAFKAVVDVFVERYEKSSSETDKPTKIAVSTREASCSDRRLPRIGGGFFSLYSGSVFHFNPVLTPPRDFLSLTLPTPPRITRTTGIPFVMIRKAGKLPGVLVSSGEYVTEYSTDETVMRFGAINDSDRVVLIDDLIATGGTALAGFELCDQLGARVHEFAAMIELPFLNGVKKIHEYKNGKFKDVPCFTVVDSLTIGEDMGRDPIGDDVPRIVKAEEVKLYELDSESGKVRRRCM